MERKIFRSLPLLLSAIIFSCRAEESLEALYRKAVQNWKSQRSWEPWNEYTKELLQKWQNEKENRHRLEIVGGFEEGILAIEKATVARGEGQNISRDITLSQLYCAYGKVLLELNADECHGLALDPHTLLIGVEKLSRDSIPSTFLCRENAENALRNAATLDANNSLAEELLESILGMESVHKRKPKEFVAELFDSFADTFDQKLVEGLGYIVPQLVGEAAERLRSSYTAVLDAGCGTGLAGRYLKPLVKDVMIGVDASKKMLDIAMECTTRKGCGMDVSVSYDKDIKEEPLYDDLLVLDLEEITLQNTLMKGSMKSNGFDLIVAADVLVYFGSLFKLLQTFAKISTSGAGLIFTCELATDEETSLGFRLLSSGRFSHTKSHALEAALNAGYELFSYQEIVPRMEKGEEVRGHLFTFVLKKKGETSVQNEL
uniref:Methyltransferase domain-containing protein n=1 Tax=Corethron hystrix TaxID=216773 RepID=A0A6U5LB49_9STRA|mmetsp:Transcript_4729/g.9316  ORF Transcript_4729/g.9316 Transcript_4729/m.9316 type:complete len:431 (+) Transcript_4729:80-1372(+)